MTLTAPMRPAYRERDDTLGVDSLADALVGELVMLPARHRIRSARRAIVLLERELTVAIAEQVQPDGSSREVDRLLDDDTITPGERRRLVRRGEVAARNSAIHTTIRTGEIAAAHLDALADADRRSKNAASADDALIQRLSSVPAAQAKRVVQTWLDDRNDITDIADSHHDQRTVRRHTGGDGLPGFVVGGAETEIEQLLAAIDARADQLYRLDGGRDQTADDHPRTNQQRLFDALADLINGRGSKRSAGDVVVTVPVAKLLGESDVLANHIGVGPISDTLLQRILARRPAYWAAILGGNGEALWLGRHRRHATIGQRIALAIRDRSCVLCGTSLRYCESHHRVPFHSPDLGKTDLANLASLCGSCHRHLHANRRTLELTPSGTWTTRPATPGETPHPQRE